MDKPAEKTRTRRVVNRNRNARVIWTTITKPVNVDQCYDVPWPIAKAFVRKHQGDSQYSGGILMAVSMPQGRDPVEDCF